jgi:hypothetical protein
MIIIPTKEHPPMTTWTQETNKTIPMAVVDYGWQHTGEKFSDRNMHEYDHDDYPGHHMSVNSENGSWSHTGPTDKRVAAGLSPTTMSTHLQRFHKGEN